MLVRGVDHFTWATIAYGDVHDTMRDPYHIADGNLRRGEGISRVWFLMPLATRAQTFFSFREITNGG